MEITTRSEIAERAGLASTVRDGTDSLQRDLDALLQDTWAGALGDTGRLSYSRNVADSRKNEDRQHVFRLLSSVKHPQRISLDPKPSPAPISREPDYEDDETQAEIRRIRSLSVAVELDCLGGGHPVATRRANTKPVIVGAKAPLANAFVGSLPTLMVTEEARASVRIRDPPEPRPSCAILPVISVSDQKEMSGKTRRKPVRERPPPAYWRPSPDQRGKCMGYALGYPSNWASNRRYVRDVMKQGVESPCHAVHDGAKPA